MPTFRAAAVPTPIEIHEFKGLNQSVGETEIKLGEAVTQNNFRLTKDFKPQKRTGHTTFIDFDNSLNTQGQWYGIIDSKEVLIACNNGNVYEYDMTVDTETTDIADLLTEGTVTLLGTITDAKTFIYWFESKIYFLNGVDWKYYDGTNYGDASDIAYEPTIAIETPPSGGGTDFEEINLATGKKNQEFTGDGSSSLYQLRELDIDADLVTIEVDGVSKVENTDFTVNRTLGQITFTSGNPVNQSLVVIHWVKASAENLGFITNNRFAMDFGPGNDTALFLWGNEEFGNKRIRTGLTQFGTIDGTYFPQFSFTLIGSDQFPITDITAQYDRQIIHKVNRTYYSYAEYIEALEKYEYPVKDLNETVGNSAFNAVRLVENSPVSIHGQSFWKWTNTSIEDERNASIISERIRNSLEELDLTSAVTFDYQKQKELWVNVEDKVYIWNYGNDTFYIYDNIQATEFTNVNGVVYYCSEGTVERFEGLSDNGTPIVATLELGFTDFGVNHLYKNSRRMWVTIQPYSRTSLNVSYQTDKINEGSEKVVKPVEFAYLDFNNLNFNALTFLTNRNPAPFRRKIRAKKYAYIKFIFSNEEEEQLVILSVKVIAETNNEVK